MEGRRMDDQKFTELSTLVILMVIPGGCKSPQEIFDSCVDFLKSEDLLFKHHLHHIRIDEVNFVLNMLLSENHLCITGGKYQLRRILEKK